ncbi:MAG: RDD family protein [Lentisphaerae bacterium]|nr:RDD family protein [Lentisphaerota bacterium]
MTQRRATLTIQTPEGIAFPLVLADPVVRFLALAIDRGCIYIASIVLSSALNLLGVISPDLAGATIMLAIFVLSIGYPIFLEWTWQGQTLGKRIMRLRVIDEDGLRLHFDQIVIRNLLRFVDALPAFYLVGGIASIVNARGQRLGDLAANTIVIRHPRILSPDLEQIAPPAYNSLRDYPHLVARLRQQLPPEGAHLALQAVLRRERFDDSARVELFAEIRTYLAELTPFPAESTESMSDEQYVRNVVDVVFRTEPSPSVTPLDLSKR